MTVLGSAYRLPGQSPRRSIGCGPVAQFPGITSSNVTGPELIGYSKMNSIKGEQVYDNECPASYREVLGNTG